MNSQEWPWSQLAITYVLTLLILGVLDGLWLGFAAKGLYRREMGELMAESPRLVPAAIFYLAYPVAIVFFALAPLPAPVSTAPAALQAFLRCAALGLVAYGTYDLTNLSVIRNFSRSLAVIDMIWGTLASGVAGSVAYGAVRWWAQHP